MNAGKHGAVIVMLTRITLMDKHPAGAWEQSSVMFKLLVIDLNKSIFDVFVWCCGSLC